MNKETLIELAKDSPLPAVASLSLFGVSVPDIILVLTLVWAAIRVMHNGMEFFDYLKERYGRKSKDSR